ncbi:hypothetical protein AB1M95_14990 [Sulfitobacter sp. LCG007]
MNTLSGFVTGLIASLCLGVSAEAQDIVGPRLSIELNSTEPADAACKLSFLVVNGHETDVSSAVFEAVLFDLDDRIERLTLFDFGDLPAGRPRVRQFVLPGLDCAALGRVLINGAQTCEAGAAGEGACSDGLELRSRVAVELVG